MERKSANRSVVLRIMMVICLIVFLVSGFLLIRDFVRSNRQQETFDELSERFVGEQISEDALKEAIDSKEEELTKQQKWKLWWEETAQERFAVYHSMKEENSDMIGWVRIEGTNIDYPVMQSPNQRDYYLHRDFYTNTSSYGTPYLSEICRYENPRTSLLISGHHMKNGSMFASLQNYTEYTFYTEHPYVQFDTMDEAGSYEVAAVIKLSASGDQTIWQNLLFPQKEGDFEQAWNRVKEQSFYDIGIELTKEDELLALVTCEYTLKNGRILLIAKRI